MPIYEEKLICPLAVRFTQEHIRPVFQDGHDLEAALAATSTRPGAGGYDVVLVPPFPSIEIVRWHHRDGGDTDGKHWVTLDNRRLYCLQRAAAALWPRRVAVSVEVLYAATDGILRKNDSSTLGLSVGIGHSPKALTSRWNWQEVVIKRGLMTSSPDAQAASGMVAADDRKATVGELADAPAAPGMLDIFLQRAACAGEPAGKPADGASDGSTTSPPTPRSRTSSGSGERSSAPSARATPAARPAQVGPALAGRWQTDKGESYEIRPGAAGCWICQRTDGDGCRRKYTLWYDESSDSIWWGDLSLFLDPSELLATDKCMQWYSSNGKGRRRARFSWYKLDAPAAGRRPRARRG